MERRHAGCSRKQKVRQFPSPVKLMVIVAYDVWGVIVCHFLPRSRTVAAQYYRDFLMRLIKEPIRGREFAPREGIANAVHQHVTRLTHGVANVGSASQRVGYVW
ncbi:hypothetical protein TNCV_4892791 [Trichonephila clavipes]|nr:hypothetical protein TNCV_4892791 [Trichonephila clavipes]